MRRLEEEPSEGDDGVWSYRWALSPGWAKSREELALICAAVDEARACGESFEIRRGLRWVAVRTTAAGATTLMLQGKLP